MPTASSLLPRWTEVYAIKEIPLGGCSCPDEPVKYGMSKDPELRCRRDLQCGNPRLLYVENSLEFESADAAAEVEAEVHSMLHSYRISGEWYLVPRAKNRALSCTGNVLTVAAETLGMKPLSCDPDSPDHFRWVRQHADAA